MVINNNNPTASYEQKRLPNGTGTKKVTYNGKTRLTYIEVKPGETLSDVLKRIGLVKP